MIAGLAEGRRIESMQLRWHHGVGEIERAQWNRLVDSDSPMLRWEWLASLEEAGCVGGETGWIPRPLALWRDDALVAACPAYIKIDSEGEFVFDWDWADAAQRAGIRYYPKLLVGVPFSPVPGRRMLTSPELADAERKQVWSRLAAELRAACTQWDLSGTHINFCEAEETPALEAQGYHQRLGLQYHWTNPGYADFEAYLADFRGKRRNQIRRERRALAEQGIEIRVHEGEDIDAALLGQMYRFYLNTVGKYTWGRRYLNPAFFELLGERFRDQLLFIVAWKGDLPVAGAFNVIGRDTLFGRYWGCIEEIRHLHFNVCYYSAIEVCIERGLRCFTPGAGGEFKRTRGFDATITRSAHHLRDPRLDDAVARFLDEERERAGSAHRWLRMNSTRKSVRSEGG